MLSLLTSRTITRLCRASVRLVPSTPTNRLNRLRPALAPASPNSSFSSSSSPSLGAQPSSHHPSSHGESPSSFAHRLASQHPDELSPSEVTKAVALFAQRLSDPAIPDAQKHSLLDLQLQRILLSFPKWLLVTDRDDPDTVRPAILSPSPRSPILSPSCSSSSHSCSLFSHRVRSAPCCPRAGQP